MSATDRDAGGSRLLDEPVEIAIVDYGMGNRRSVEKAFEHIGASVSISSDHDRLRSAAGLVVPGVGAFPRGMASLRELGLDELLRERLERGIPVLGICLGMQLAFERSTEQGGAIGLGLIPGEVHRLPRAEIFPGADTKAGHAQGAQGRPGGEPGSLKLPHIGWNEVSFGSRSRGGTTGSGLRSSSPFTDGLPERCAFYHVHSFAPVPAEREDVLGTAIYGVTFASVVARGGFYGVQFHPEKSSAAGLRLLANFARICARAAVPVGP